MEEIDVSSLSAQVAYNSYECMHTHLNLTCISESDKLDQQIAIDETSFVSWVYNYGYMWSCHGTAQIIRTKVQKPSPEQLNSRT
jgi:hypothetical protein